MLDDVVTINLNWVRERAPFVEFFIPGEPATQGSHRAWLHPTLAKCLRSPDDATQLPELLEDPELAKKMRRPYVTDDNPEMVTWRFVVASAGNLARKRKPVLRSGPLLVTCEFILERRKGDLGTGKNTGKARPSAPRWSEVKCDVGKFVRCVEDGLTTIIWRDDAQVAMQITAKRYARNNEQAGVHVAVYQLHQQPQLL